MKKRKFWALLSLSVLIAFALSLSGCGIFTVPKADNSFPFDAAVENGYPGTRSDWLASQDTPSTLYRRLYEEALLDGSFSGTYFEFLLQLGLKEDDTPAINSALCSAVSIECYYQDTNGQAGSGIVWSVDKAAGDAYIVTNYHVLYNSAAKKPLSTSIYVWMYGEKVSSRAMLAQYVGGTMEYDIAVLFIDGDTQVRDTLSNTHTNAEVIQNSSVTAATFADSDSITLGERVYAVGNPAGQGLSAVSGIVSVDLEYISVWTADGSKVVSMPEIRTDASINHGNSGGGLFNSMGEVVGLVNARSEADGVVGFGYAIPANVVSAVVNNLFDNDGSLLCARLGLTLEVADSLSVFDEKTGKIYIEEKVIAGSVSLGAAYSAGIRGTDTILSATLKSQTGENTVAVTRKQKLLTLLFDVRQGDTLTLTVSRNGKLQDIDVNFSSSSDFTKIA